MTLPEMWDFLSLYLQYSFVQRAMIVTVLVALCSALLGVTLVLRRFSFIGDGLSHVAFGAMAVAAVLNLASELPLVLAVTVICAVLLLRTGQNAKIMGDAAMAMVSVGALAIGYLLMNIFSSSTNLAGDVCTTLFGSTSILTLTEWEVWLCVGLAVAVTLLFVLFYHQIFAVTFDENFAAATGVRTGMVNLLLAVVVTCGLIYGALKWLDHYTRHNEAVVVPDVKGLKIEEAAEFFKNNNLHYNVIDSVFSKDVEPGAIVELSPLAGSKVKEGRIVFITVNALTSQMATIPEVEDLSFRQAYALLKARGFENVEIEYVPGDFKDLAVSVDLRGRALAKGEHVPLTAPLVLKVSSGEAEMLPDSLSIDSLSTMPIESLDSEEENWF